MIMRKMNLLIKRLFDIVASALGLLLLSPLFLLFSIWIKLDSEGPVFFLQDRLGYRGKTFRLIKFRTMVQNAEHIGEGVKVLSEKDPRITKSGRVLRKTSIDELPQLINVLLGDMSIVGPRPPVVYHPYKGFENYPEWAKKRFEMRPGITGLAQEEVRASAPWDDRFKYDIDYVEHFSVFLDIKIIFKTFIRIFKADELYLGQ